MTRGPWPTQAECDDFYGNPRHPRDPASSNSVWESNNLVLVKAPFVVRYEGTPVRGLRVHSKVAASLGRVLDAIWEAAGRDQSVIDDWGMSNYGGGYTYRLMRTGRALSMHSYGCALDFDVENNGLGDTTPRFAKFPQVVGAFEAEGWTWGGRWEGKGCDGMHFQAAYVR